MDLAVSLPDFLRRAADLFETLPETRPGAPTLRQIADSTAQPFNLAVVGRMKTGKSTLINSLIGRELAITDVEEATATINWLCHGTGSQTSQFIVHWKNGRPEESLPCERLADWTGKTPEVMARAQETAFLRLFANSDKLRKVQIIDTPGTGSAVEAHEAIAREFLNPDVVTQSVAEGEKSDAIVYVVAPVGRESDVENLELFCSERLPNTGPYNSVCAVHKWDSMQVSDPAADAAGKAARLKEQLSDMVADVIPVSGPIALAARCAPVDFFGRLMECMALQGTPELERLLKTPDRWDRDEGRAGVRKLFQLPWSSFTLIVRQVRDVPRGDIPMAMQRCLDYSRIEYLERFIEDRFFSLAGIIKQFKALEKAQQIYEPSIRKITAEVERLGNDADKAKEAAGILSSPAPSLSAWMTSKTEDCSARKKKLDGDILAIDREWENLRADLEGLALDLRVSEAMNREPGLFPAEDHLRLRSLCNHLASPSLRSQIGMNQLPTLTEVQQLLEVYRSKTNQASRKNRVLFEHIIQRLGEVYQILATS